MDAKIQVGGLAQLSRGLKALSNDAPKELRLALNASAEEFVQILRPKIPVDTGAARRSVVARSTRTAARIAVGGKKAPYYPWLDFGGQGRRAGRPAPRPFIREGRYFYPTLIKERSKIEKSLHDGISALIRNAGLEEG